MQRGNIETCNESHRFDIVVYDAYRPSTASEDLKVKGGSEAMKECYFPRADGEGGVMDEGWWGRDRSHGRGSTVRGVGCVMCDV